MILLNSIFRWLMIFMGGIMIIVSIVTIIVSKLTKKSTPKLSIFSIVIGLIIIAYIVIRMMANSYNTF